MITITRRLPVICIAVLLFSAAPHYSFAWGKKGHGIVAEVAFSLLDTNTKQFVYKYLGTTSIEDAATWMDDVRSDHSYDYMKTWHYLNIEKGSEYTPTKDGNIVNALNSAITVLEHKDKLSDEEIKKNLMIIFHLVGDFHMPLHVGYGVDKGGNDVHVTYLNKQSNLHRVWDTDMIESEHISKDDCMALYKKMGKKEIKSLQEIDVVKWINQPRALLTNVYAYNQKDNTIDQAYVDKNKEVVAEQLLVAGIRLAAVLHKVAS